MKLNFLFIAFFTVELTSNKPEFNVWSVGKNSPSCFSQMYSNLNFFLQAIKYHKQELTISKEVNDRSSEASTHGNLAVAYQALNMHDIGVNCSRTF